MPGKCIQLNDCVPMLLYLILDGKIGAPLHTFSLCVSQANTISKMSRSQLQCQTTFYASAPRNTCRRIHSLNTNQQVLLRFSQWHSVWYLQQQIIKS